MKDTTNTSAPQAQKLSIKHRWNGETLFEDEAENMKELVLRAIASGADLFGADLSEADLFGAINMSLAKNFPRIPKVENLDAKILAAIDAGGTLDMGAWHDFECGTAHCRAGWAIHLAGEAGYLMESFIGPKTAGQLIYHASAGYIPNFFAGNGEALTDIRAKAAEAAEASAE